MSNKVAKITKDMVKQEQVITKSINYQIDVEIDGVGEKSTYMTVTGVPEDLPEAYMDTVKAAAERQFAEALNTRTFLEFYNVGKTSKDEHPCFYNMKDISWITVIEIKEIK
ncbi:MAG: hypothetical protein IKQ22_03730 [Clostridia bacterium]|nr:hypothetical protein [Clostridia bacterium]